MLIIKTIIDIVNKIKQCLSSRTNIIEDKLLGSSHKKITYCDWRLYRYFGHGIDALKLKVFKLTVG